MALQARNFAAFNKALYVYPFWDANYSTCYRACYKQKLNFRGYGQLFKSENATLANSVSYPAQT